MYNLNKFITKVRKIRLQRAVTETFAIFGATVFAIEMVNYLNGYSGWEEIQLYLIALPIAFVIAALPCREPLN